MNAVNQTLAAALSGAKPARRWAVVGTNSRGMTFRLDHYKVRRDAVDFAEEVRGNGGTAKVVAA